MMRKFVLLLILTVIMIGGCTFNMPDRKFHAGEMLYHKILEKKVQITCVVPGTNSYRIKYRDRNGRLIEVLVSEYELKRIAK